MHPRAIAGKPLTMAQSIREVMTADPRTVEPGATLKEAAAHMRDGDVGAVLVVENGSLTGIVTDRDIAVRAVAEGRDPASTTVADVCTKDPATLTVDQTVDDAIRFPAVEVGDERAVVELAHLVAEQVQFLVEGRARGHVDHGGILVRAAS